MLNRFGSILSLVSGLGMITLGAEMKDLATGLSGIGACTMAVVLFQLSDIRARVIRLEDHAINGESKRKR